MAWERELKPATADEASDSAAGARTRCRPHRLSFPVVMCELIVVLSTRVAAQIYDMDISGRLGKKKILAISIVLDRLRNEISLSNSCN